MYRVGCTAIAQNFFWGLVSAGPASLRLNTMVFLSSLLPCAAQCGRLVGVAIAQRALPQYLLALLELESLELVGLDGMTIAVRKIDQ